jgi:hypothetical protein
VRQGVRMNLYFLIGYQALLNAWLNPFGYLDGWIE